MKFGELFTRCENITSRNQTCVYRTIEAYTQELFSPLSFENFRYYADCEVSFFKVDKSGRWHVLIED